MAIDTLASSKSAASDKSADAVAEPVFARLIDALEAAARGAGSSVGYARDDASNGARQDAPNSTPHGAPTGLHFYDLRGERQALVTHAALRDAAQTMARRLISRFQRGDKVAIVAETSPAFVVAFFACQYAGVTPAPVPLPVNLGGKEGYLQQIRLMCLSADARGVIGPEGLKGFLSEAVEGLADTSVYSFEDVDALPEATTAPEPFTADEQCYIQFSSGSTSAPKGVIGTQSSVCANLHAITHFGIKISADDSVVSWLPLYHDMGLIGFLLSPIYAGISAHYIATSDFVRRPLLWLRLITALKGTITYSPSFGYELAARRAARAEEGAIDLSNLRVAGIGADMVRPEALNAFAEAFEAHGFDANAFLPSYGMAEATLAITFTTLNAPIEVDYVDMRHFNRSGVAQPASAVTPDDNRRAFVKCGRPIPGHDLRVCGEGGAALEDRQVGRIFIKGPSLTPGYYGQKEATDALFDGDWLDTGDMGYMLDGQIVITGRAKDLIIINGRNIWPQDIEWAVEDADGVRKNGVAAFSVDDGVAERIVVIVERRGGMSADELAALKRDIAKTIQGAAGAPAEIVLARPHSMVMTSSGKLSRAKVKAKYLAGAFDEDVDAAPPQKTLAEARI
ncbi:MAG: fatty acyl-AMP ligase [Pseudomonadota bacterium]